jgi:uncharacterized protein involved in type VI secretion and phage assembly
MATDMSWLKQLDGALRGDHPALRVGDLPYELTVDVFSAAMPHRLAVVSPTAEERLNGLYEYNIELVTAFPPEVYQPAVFGQNASILLRTPGHDGRIVKGIISALQACGVADRGLGKGLFRYVATLVPRLWLWTQRKRTRVSQDKSVVDVATEMLKADKIRFKVKLRDEGKEYPKQPLFYQRDETEFDFFTRIRWANQVDASGRCSELSISDPGNNEKVTIHSAKDLNVDAAHSRAESIGADVTLAIAGNSSKHITGNLSRRIDGTRATRTAPVRHKAIWSEETAESRQLRASPRLGLLTATPELVELGSF